MGSLQQILSVRFLDRWDRFQGDSFSESGAKVNCVMVRACLPYACFCAFCVCPFMCVYYTHNVRIMHVYPCGGMCVWNAAECVEYVHVCLCTVLYGRVWAVRITQRLHHIENQHIAGSQAHTNRLHHRAFSFLRKGLKCMCLSLLLRL